MTLTPRWRDDASPDAVVLAVSKCLIASLNVATWKELALLTGTREYVGNHARLLRSLNFGDDDYAGHVMTVVPRLLGERRVAVGGVHSRFPKLQTVTDFVGVTDWLARNEPLLFRQTCLPSEQDSTLPDGTVVDAAEAAAARLGVAEMRRQVERIRRDYAADPEALVGQAKDLIESACKTILNQAGSGAKDDDVPALVHKTLKHLGLHPQDLPDGDDQSEARALRRVMGGFSTVLQRAAELRNARGTGHGRSRGPLVDDALARATVSMVLAVVVYLCEKYETYIEPGAEPPELESSEPQSLIGRGGMQHKRGVSVAVGMRVHHETFGWGQVVDVGGASERDRTAQVQFEDGAMKWLLLRYAPLHIA